LRTARLPSCSQKTDFTEEQFTQADTHKARKNIYIPRSDETGQSTALHEFPVSILSREKESAGVVKIPRPE
jgi:hypothetical protein